MNLADFLEKFGRTVFEAPFAVGQGSEPPEVAEIRLAILEQVRAKCYRSGGKRVFPCNLVHIHVRGVEDSRAPLFNGKFFRQYFEQELRRHLDKEECRYPEDLQVDVQVLRELPMPGEQWVWVEIESREKASPAPAATRRAARLVVMEGKANEAEITLSKARTNIGRTVDVYRAEGPLRRNDLAFTEDTEINRTVSREHAHIIHDRAAGEYRLFNDRWYQRDTEGPPAPATWIVRDGLSQPVHRTARGTKLEHGDEIHLGRAVVRFQVK
ncbi:MAG TPA: FHA domain-containing protein [Bryobacteraceae bacterium]|nr:FHA domain-containing protein [Bryobacteraceae bacterium]